MTTQQLYAAAFSAWLVSWGIGFFDMAILRRPGPTFRDWLPLGLDTG